MGPVWVFLSTRGERSSKVVWRSRARPSRPSGRGPRGVVLQDALSEVTKFYPPIKLRVFVDDITALLMRKNREVSEMAKKVIKKLKEEVERKGLNLSVTEDGKEGKSKMMARDMKVGIKKMLRAGMMPARTCEEGSHGEVEIKETRGSSSRQEEHDFVVPIHGSIRPCKRSRVQFKLLETRIPATLYDSVAQSCRHLHVHRPPHKSVNSADTSLPSPQRGVPTNGTGSVFTNTHGAQY